MQNKVTNYEISKRLDELKFDCESHTWWWRKGHPQKEIELVSTDDMRCLTGSGIKAYDSWDLLMWLQQHYRSNDTTAEYIGDLTIFGDTFEYTTNPAEDNRASVYPQNALGYACIKILKERDE